MSFTKHSGTTANQIYEKLRKRSYRTAKRGYFTEHDRIDHEAYVKGVRDALHEVYG